MKTLKGIVVSYPKVLKPEPRSLTARILTLGDTALLNQPFISNVYKVSDLKEFKSFLISTTRDNRNMHTRSSK